MDMATKGKHQERNGVSSNSNARQIHKGHGGMVIIVGNRHSNTSSNPGRDCLHFTLH